MKIAAIVLAAGKSERMGRNKLLLDLGGKTIIERVLDALKKVNIAQIIVVVGHEKIKIKELLKKNSDKIEIIVNYDYKNGMTSSFKAGIKCVEKYADAAFLVLGDQLIFNTKQLGLMINKLNDNILIVSPRYKGKKGHPVLFSSKLFEKILNLENEEILRDLIHRHKNYSVTVCGEKWNIKDIDIPEDFIEAKKDFKNNQFNNKG